VNIVETILEGQSVPIQKSLFADATILETLQACSRRNDEISSKSKGTRAGYMGHVIHMANSIIDWHKELSNQVNNLETNSPLPTDSLSRPSSNSTSTSLSTSTSTISTSTTTTTTTTTTSTSTSTTTSTSDNSSPEGTTDIMITTPTTPLLPVLSSLSQLTIPTTLEGLHELRDIVTQQIENKDWKSFVKDKLATNNERMQIVLGGHRPGDITQGQPPPGAEHMSGPEHGQPTEEFGVRPDDDDDDELFNFDDPEIEDNPEAANEAGEFENFFVGQNPISDQNNIVA